MRGLTALLSILLLPLFCSPSSADDAAVEAFRKKFAIGSLEEFQIPLFACAQDGQLGYMPPHKLPRSTTVRLPNDARADQLAFYSKEENGRAGVIAPRGWTCMGAYGSNGSILTVRPKGAEGQFWRVAYHGPHVTRTLSEGGTSGRFQVAAVAARLFPDGRLFARDVESEEAGTRKYATSPWPRDRLTPLGNNLTAFETPGGGQGLGMEGDGPYAATGVEGIVHFFPGTHDSGDPYLLQLDVRPDLEMGDLFTATAIVFLDRLDPGYSRGSASTIDASGASNQAGSGSDALSTVRAFYEALGRADGNAASNLVVRERRSSGPYAPGSISRFYASLSEPLRLVSASPAGSGAIQVRYRYRKPNGSPCEGAALVDTITNDRETLITRIKPANGC